MSIDMLEWSLAVGVGFLMAWAIGANDVANAMASTVGSKILTVRQAVVIAAIFEAVGALVASGQVTNMIRAGMIDTSAFSQDPHLFVLGMLAALMASSTWLIIATMRAWPVSTTHTIIGSILGFALVCVPLEQIRWWNCIEIASSWVLTPIIAMFVAYTLFYSIKTQVFSVDNPLDRAGFYIPWYMTMVTGVFTYVTVFQGLKPLGVVLSLQSQCGILALIAISSLVLGKIYVRAKLSRISTVLSAQQQHEGIEQMFSSLAVITAASMAFAHGSNDVANAIGPVVAVVQVIQTKVVASTPAAIPLWLLYLGAFGVVTGLMSYGYKIMQTVGSQITQLTPSRGFAAQFSTSCIIVIASGLGLPVSTTQTMVGAILGVGLARGLMALNMRVIKGIFISWLITLPAGALLAAGYFLALQQLLVK